jgi:hypothetical protein
MEPETTVRILVALGFGLLLVLLRLDAERFGTAEYDEAGGQGRPRSLRRRLSWYALGIGLIVAARYVYPLEATHPIYLGLGERASSLVGGLIFAVIGTAQALLFALYRYGHVRFPDIRDYPGALLNAVATAFIDEAAFRGILLAYLVGLGVQPLVAVVLQALLYALCTRLGAPGRDRYMLALALLIGLGSGWLTVVVGGIGGAFIGHAVTRCAVFLTTGHAGQLAPRGRETEDLERKRRTPDGWRVVGAKDPGGGDR